MDPSASKLSLAEKKSKKRQRWDHTVEYYKIYGRFWFLVMYPVILLPIILLKNEPATRCLYVVLLITGYLVGRTLPLPITALMPVVLFPAMGIADSLSTVQCYISEKAIIIFADVNIILAVQNCNLHHRIALILMYKLSCNPRHLHFSVMVITCFLAMWLNPEGATLFICPIADAILDELDNQHVYILRFASVIRPKKMVTAYFLGACFAANIGFSMVTMETDKGSAFLEIYKEAFPNMPLISMFAWFLFTTPVKMVSLLLVWMWLEFLYMGMFRENSAEAKLICMNDNRTKSLKENIKEDIRGLGRMNSCQMSVTILCLLYLFFNIISKGNNVFKWFPFINKLEVSEGTVAVVIVFFMYVIPKNFKQRRRSRARTSKNGSTLDKNERLLNWRLVNMKMPWGLLILFGAFDALAHGAIQSGMIKTLISFTENLPDLTKYGLLLVMCLFVMVLTQIASNVAVITIALPLNAGICIQANWNPVFFIVPVTIASSFSFCFPNSAPPNCIVVEYTKLDMWDMLLSGLGATFICLIVLLGLFGALGGLLFDIHSAPKYVKT